ncbi:MAG: hypothetical protein L0Z70_06030 [Chloroflexi bacterium]|nr:hypothetical protein [Chloroflexota bacterium]
MQTCTQCYAQSPDSAEHCGNCQADLKETSQTAVALKRFRSNSRVLHLRLVTSDDCCPACRQAEGYYPKDQAPALPVEGCSHPMGCRCFYEPMLTEIYP